MKHKTILVGFVLAFLLIESSSVSANYGPTKAMGIRQAKITQKIDKKANIKGVITALSENTLTVSSDGKSYTINISQSTQETQWTLLKRKYLGKATSAEFSVDNKVKVMGTWTNDEHSVIDASRI